MTLLKSLSDLDLSRLLSLPPNTTAFLETSENFDRGAMLFLELSSVELEGAILQIRNRIRNDSQKVGVTERSHVWEEGWRENEALFRKVQVWDALQPRYYLRNRDITSCVTGFHIYRLFGRLIQTPRIDFESQVAEAHRTLLFGFMCNVMQSPPPIVMDIGCGPGLNLLTLHRTFPNSDLIAADFVGSALECTQAALLNTGANTAAMHFDFTDPPADLSLPAGSLVVTVGALEQVGNPESLGKFKAWIMKQRGVWFCHAEPFTEFYQPDVFLDDLMLLFAEKRGYTTGFLPWIRNQFELGSIANFREQRVRLGSPMLEGYNYCLYQVS